MKYLQYATNLDLRPTKKNKNMIISKRSIQNIDLQIASNKIERMHQYKVFDKVDKKSKIWHILGVITVGHNMQGVSLLVYKQKWIRIYKDD